MILINISAKSFYRHPEASYIDALFAKKRPEPFLISIETGGINKFKEEGQGYP
jgi:hypothetical protein